MPNYWPLLVGEPFEGDTMVNSQLRPPAGAVAVDNTNYAAASEAVTELCGSWGGCAMPLLAVSPGSGFNERWSRILLESNIDGIERTDLLTTDIQERFSDVGGPSSALLLRVLVELPTKSLVQTCRGVAEHNPWHLSYLAALGDLPQYPHSQNSWNDLPDDLTYQDVVTIEQVQDAPGAEGDCPQFG